jgi:hypothetical protein
MFTIQTSSKDDPYGTFESAGEADTYLHSHGWIRCEKPTKFFHKTGLCYVLDRRTHFFKLYAFVEKIKEIKPISELPSGPIPDPPLTMYEVGLKPEAIHCDGCGKDFHYEKTEIRSRDLGAYPGWPLIEGRELYIPCPTCGRKKVIEVPVETV